MSQIQSFSQKGSSSIGTVVQQVRASTNALITCDQVINNDDTIPQQTEGVEVLTATITPTSADINNHGICNIKVL